MPRKGDLVAVGVLAALAFLVFGIPSLAGHPVLPGDDMTQNYPLRVLAGREIRAGHLPLYDPYIWSGAPLLADWNAAAAYPLTWVFAVLPGVAAWTFGLVFTYAAAAIAMFAFLRALRLRTVAAFAGALTFAFGGAMAAQVTHFGLVSGMSWVPLALLAVTRLSAPGDGGGAGPGGSLRPRLGWIAVLGLAVGLLVLAGEPRAIADGAVIIGLYAAWRALRLGRRRWASLACVAGGAVLGGALSAVQWLPGLAAISTSQRAGASLELFSSGSLPDRWLLLMLVPDLLGGSGTLSQPGFFGFYNLTEVAGYAGILPLVAAFALLARLPLRSWARGLLRRRPAGQLTGPSRPPAPHWLVWHAMAVVGVALALGGNSPLGPVLARLPFYGTQRLQSRNILVLDLALAVLLAYWADQPFPERLRRVARVPVDAIAGALPAAGVAAVAIAGLAWTAGLTGWLDASAAPGTAALAALQPWLVPFAVLGVAAVAMVSLGRRLPGRTWSRLLACFVVVDVIAFSALAVVEVAPRPAAGGSGVAASPTGPGGPGGRGGPPAGAGAAPGGARGTDVGDGAHGTLRAVAVPHMPARPIAALGYPGRFAIYDPGLLDTAELSVLEPPDLNSINATASVQGYTSLVDGRYAAATGSHLATGNGQNVLSQGAVGDVTLDTLDTTILLTLPGYAAGDLRDALVPPHWVLDGYDGSFAIYRNTRAHGPLTLSALPGTALSGASVRPVAGPASGPTRAAITSVAGVRVVRSVAAIPGWTATWQPLAGPASPGRATAGHPITLPVQTAGVVQAVDVPAGTGVLTWHYRPPRLVAGLALSLAALTAVLLLCLAGLARRGNPGGAWLRWPRAAREAATARGELAT
jgi:hypothetical protein